MKALLLDEALIRKLYDDGISLKGIAAQLQVSRPVIGRRLRGMGLAIRSSSEANKLRMARLTPEERLANAKKAHDAIRGARRGDKELIKRAKCRQENPYQRAPEAEIMRQLREAGIETVPLYALFKYNFDLAIPEARLALEVHNTWHTAPKKAHEDAKKLECAIACDWLILYVNIEFFTAATIDDIRVMCENRRARYMGHYQHHHQ